MINAAVIQDGKAAAAQSAGLHAEVAAVFLHHDVGSGLRRAEETVLALIDGEFFGDAASIGGVVVVPAGVELLELDRVWPVAIDLVGAHVDEHGLRGMQTCGLQQVEGAGGIDVKVIKGT